MLTPRRRLWTEGPEGPLCLRVVLAAIAMVVGPAASVGAHGEVFDVVVEAVGSSDQPSDRSYGIVLTFIDGHEMSGATIVVKATAENGAEVEAAAAETTPGVYIADLTLDSGSWRVVVGVEAPEGEGSVEFTEEVSESALTEPVVRVDTANPDRQGEVVDAGSSVFAVAAPPAAVTTIDLRVEALVRDAVAPLIIEYGVVTEFLDATVLINATSEDSVVVGPIALTAMAPGVFSGVVEYPGAATWEVTVEVGGSAVGTAVFTERLPWPHYTTEAGFPKIKANSDDPSLEGSLIEISESPIFGVAAPSPSTTIETETTTSAPAESPDHEVVVSLPSSGFAVGRQVGFRWLHLASLGLWAGSIAAIGLGHVSRRWAITAVGGVIATVATGVVLALWGAPSPFPGIFAWSELATRFYGPSYQWAFVIKMIFVVVGIVATSLLVARSSRARLAVAAGSMLAALAAVVAMAQFHLFTHL